MAGFTVPLARWFYQGQVSPGAKIYVYQTGTTTPVTVYSNGSLSTPTTNPVTCDSNGEAVFYVSNQVALRLYVTTSSGTLIRDIDPVYPVEASYLIGQTAGLAKVNAALILGSNRDVDYLDVEVLKSNGAYMILPPGGRLTLTSGTPVMTADATAQTAVYYAPHSVPTVPIFDGSYWLMHAFNQLTLNLSSNAAHTGYHQSGKNFDLFVYLNGSTVRLGTGPAWSSDTARGTGAGTTELQRLNGVWVNARDITLRYGNSSGDTNSVSSLRATYVGTMRTTADGQTGMSFKPAAAAGGGNNVLGLWNAYNRVRVTAMSRDSTSSWTYATATWRSANNNTANRISWVDGLQVSTVQACYQVGNDNAGAVAALVGVNIDSTSATPSVAAQGTTSGSTQQVIAPDTFFPQLGFHYAQAMEYATGATATFRGVANSQQQQALTLSLEM